MKFYAVAVGREAGIYTNWEDCKTQIHNFKGAMFKSFKLKEDAEKFVDNEKQGRLYLFVHYNQKDEIKRLGGRWDFERKNWFIYNNNPKKDDILKVFKPIQ